MATSSDRPIVVFDLDGTLVDVAARDYAVYRDLLIEDGLPVLPFETYWPLRRERTHLAAILAHSAATPETYMRNFVTRRTSRYEAVEYLELDVILPAVPVTLAAVGERFDCVLITSRSDAIATGRQLDTLDLRRYFRAVHVADGDKPGAIRLLTNVAMVVGDTEHDIALARERDCPSFLVTTGIRSSRFLASAGPTHLADCLADLLKVI